MRVRFLVAAASAALSAAAPSAGATASACGAATASVVGSTFDFFGARLYASEHKGGEVDTALARVQGSSALAAAAAAGDPVATRAAVTQLLFSHLHIVRMRVVKGGHVLSDLGAGNALAPVSGALRQGGKPVARFFISLQDEHGYTLLVRRLIGAQVVLRSGGHVLPDSTLRPGPARLPLRGSVSYRGTVWEAASFHAQAFPRGALRIWLLVPLPPPARASCADVHLNLVARVAHLAYAEALAASKGAAVKLRNSAPLVDAVAARDAGSASAALRTLAAQGRFVRAQVSVNGSPLADAGTGAALAPFAGTLGPPGAGFTVASESDSSYVTLIQAITNARVLVRSGATQLAGSLVPGPVAVPARGTVAYGGVTYSALSFSATAFPQGPLRLSLLVR